MSQHSERLAALIAPLALRDAEHWAGAVSVICDSCASFLTFGGQPGPTRVQDASGTIRYVPGVTFGPGTSYGYTVARLENVPVFGSPANAYRAATLAGWTVQDGSVFCPGCRKVAKPS